MATTTDPRTASAPSPAGGLATLGADLARFLRFLASPGEGRVLVGLLGLFGALYYLPVGVPRFDNAVFEALELTRWYAREHVMLCLVPAFFIAGAIGVFLSQASVMRYLGAEAKRTVAYGVAAVSGTILAVCSCTVLPIFASIHKRGAGLGPAIAFLYSGPAINILAIILTARVLGFELGIARAVTAVLCSVVVGGLMHFIFRREEAERARGDLVLPDGGPAQSLGMTALFFAFMVAVLVFANWGAPAQATGFFAFVHAWKWPITTVAALGFALLLARRLAIPLAHVAIAALPAAAGYAIAPEAPLVPFTLAIAGLTLLLARTRGGEAEEWLASTWGFAKQITPLLFAGVVFAGFALGRPGHEGVIPSSWIASAVGGNSFAANFIAAIVGAFMYFATLTEVPILEGLIGSGMGRGPALALLLAGPALSLPNMLVIRSVIGTKKTVVYCSLVIVFATLSGLIYGALA